MAKPTAREKWAAFHRLWRIANRAAKESYFIEHDMNECFWALGYYRYEKLMRSREDGPPIPLHKVPSVLRRHVMKSRVNERMYGKHPDWKERDQQLIRAMRDKGIETTPEEVHSVRMKLLGIFRQSAIELGIDMPADDATAFDLAMKTIRQC